MRARDADASPHIDTSYHTDVDIVVPEQLFAVVVVWESGAWTGWLTTTTHRSTCFCPADLAELRFQAWLAALPGWEPAHMEQALVEPGLHLVWRRPSD